MKLAKSLVLAGLGIITGVIAYFVYEYLYLTSGTRHVN